MTLNVNIRIVLLAALVFVVVAYLSSTVAGRLYDTREFAYQFNNHIPSGFQMIQN